MPRRSADRFRGRMPGEGGASRVADRLVALFGLGVLLFNPLVVRIFDGGAATTVFGVPLLYFYLFAGWALLIALLAWAVAPASDRQGGERHGGEE
jgi:hypothetical protein